MYAALNLQDLVTAELAQRRESGYLLGPEHDRPAHDAEAGHDLDDAATDRMLDELDQLDRRPDWAYHEPDDLAAIIAAADWPGSTTSPDPARLDDGYRAAVGRAWSGRVAGNMLGKPVENGDLWTPAAIRSLLESADSWPLADYFPDVEPGPDLPRYLDNRNQTLRGKVDGSSRDDDVDYTILNLHLLRRHGTALQTADVAAGWLTLLPFLQTYTAERVALRNVINGVPIERAARHRNPYREYIGAAIRADVFGYICPGDPAAAAELSYRDAALSHTGNGIYGEMWCAALVAAAFDADSTAAAIDASLAVVPKQSRLYEAIDQTRGWHRSGLSWEETRTKIESDFGDYSWIHMINNAAVLTAGLLYGDGDFSRSIGLTVCGGWDTDSNGGTAGSVAAILADDLDPHWTEPLADTIRSAVFGYDGSSIAELAGWTVDVAVAARNGQEAAVPGSSIPRSAW